VSEWKQFEKDTIGRQLVRSIDSINANLAEGDGRFGVADGLHFFVIARGSVRESILWIRRAIERSPVSEVDAAEELAKLQEGLRQLNLLINYRRNQGKFVRDEQLLYMASGEE
jgi:four helix bundle protein